MALVLSVSAHVGVAIVPTVVAQQAHCPQVIRHRKVP